MDGLHGTHCASRVSPLVIRISTRASMVLPLIGTPGVLEWSKLKYITLQVALYSPPVVIALKYGSSLMRSCRDNQTQQTQ